MITCLFCRNARIEQIANNNGHDFDCAESQQFDTYHHRFDDYDMTIVALIIIHINCND